MSQLQLRLEEDIHQRYLTRAYLLIRDFYRDYSGSEVLSIACRPPRSLFLNRWGTKANGTFPIKPAVVCVSVFCGVYPPRRSFCSFTGDGNAMR
ncbi:uncharacterized [Tachysurus ichikawai]